MNLDGHADILVGTDTAGPGGSSGTVVLYSGIDGQPIWTWTGVAPTYAGLGKVVAAAGDLNLDGVPDVLITAPNSTPTGPRALVYSGADATLLRAFVAPPGLSSYGESAALIGDTNGDGVPDYAIGAPHWIGTGTDSGRVYVFSGATGAQRFLVDGGGPNDRFGSSIAGTGDLNNDGIPDIAIGAPQNNVNPAQPGYVDIRSGTNGALIRHITGAAGEKWFGLSLSSRADLDLDGKSDLVIGAPNSIFNGLSVGTVALVSGASGNRIATYSGTVVGGYFGHSVAWAGDVDRDGLPDVLVGVRDDPQPAALSGSVRLICTRDGSTMLKLSGTMGVRLGTSCATGDVDADGIPDLVVGGPGKAPGGHVFVWSSCPLPPHSYCSSTATSETFGALMGWTGTTSFTQNNFSVSVTDAIAGGPGLFYYGNGSAQVPFGDGVRCVSGTTVRLSPILFASPTGGASFALDVQQPPLSSSTLIVAPGSLIYLQYWFRDAGVIGGSGFNLSNALAVTFCP